MATATLLSKKLVHRTKMAAFKAFILCRLQLKTKRRIFSNKKLKSMSQIISNRSAMVAAVQQLPLPSTIILLDKLMVEEAQTWAICNHGTNYSIRN